MTNNEGTEPSVPKPDVQHEFPADRDHTGESSKLQQSSPRENVHPSEGESTNSSNGDDERLALLDRLARLQGEVSNWRKRAEREQAELRSTHWRNQSNHCFQFWIASIGQYTLRR
jgi:molecular chaperone GrpE (heat shock protein)